MCLCEFFVCCFSSRFGFSFYFAEFFTLIDIAPFEWDEMHQQSVEYVIVPFEIDQWKISHSQLKMHRHYKILSFVPIGNQLQHAILFSFLSFFFVLFLFLFFCSLCVWVALATELVFFSSFSLCATVDYRSKLKIIR